MKIFVMSIVLVACSITGAGYSCDPDIRGNSLIRWPMNFKGVAVIPSEVRYIGNEAFSGCSELTAVIFPETLETIGSFAFSGCSRLGEAKIPSSVVNVGRSTFFNCQSMTNLLIFAKLEKIPGNMCSHCYGLRHVELPNGLVEVGDMAFRGCRSLQIICIPSSVRRICRGAFIGCSRLSGVEFPRGMGIIDDFAFYGCYDLKRLVLRSVPEKIGEGVFRDCHNLRGYILSGISQTNVLYTVPSLREISAETICKEEGFVGKYETVEDALSAGDRIGNAEMEKGLFEGLERALRIAADGMVDEMPDVYYPVGKVDSLAANLFKLSALDSIQEIKDYFKKYSSTSVDIGNKLVANLSIPNDIAITVEFYDEKPTKLTLSDGLKKVIFRRLKKGIDVADDVVLKWLK